VVVTTFTKRRVALFVCLIILASAFACSFAGTGGEDNVSCLPAIVLVFCVILISDRSSVVFESLLVAFQPSVNNVSLRAPPRN
jgi:hypothetical protein